MKILERHKETLERDFSFDRVRFVPIDVTNVAEWYFTESEVDMINLRDFPCVISPFQHVWFEYRVPRLWKIRDLDTNVWQTVNTSFPDETRCGVLILQTTVDEGFGQDNPVEGRFVSKLKELIHDYKPPRFCQSTYYFLSDKEKIQTPLMCDAYIDEDGRILGTVARWDQVIIGEDAQAQNFQRTWGYPVYFSISLMHCKNVRVDEAPALPEKVIKKRLKRGKPVVQYKTIFIDSIKRQSSVNGSGGETGLLKAIDIMRGHFKDYSQGRGLFGRLHGRYWWNERASAESKRDYKIRYPRQ